MGVYGKNFPRDDDDLQVRIGRRPCLRSVWVSPSMIACMVPRGVEQGQSVLVRSSSGDAELRATFRYAGLCGPYPVLRRLVSYDLPTAQSFQPKTGPPRGGFFVTVHGVHFGPEDSTPSIAVAGKSCVENFWISDSSIMCRAREGVGHNFGAPHKPPAIEAVFDAEQV